MKTGRADRPTRVCAVCGRPFQWRRKWKDVWQDVRYCSERCRRRRNSASHGREPEAHHSPAPSPGSDLPEVFELNFSTVLEGPHGQLNLPISWFCRCSSSLGSIPADLLNNSTHCANLNGQRDCVHCELPSLGPFAMTAQDLFVCLTLPSGRDQTCGKPVENALTGSGA
jgi:hypothetical protein